MGVCAGIGMGSGMGLGVGVEIYMGMETDVSVRLPILCTIAGRPFPLLLSTTSSVVNGQECCVRSF